MNVNCVVCEKLLPSHFLVEEDNSELRVGDSIGVLNDGVICRTHGNYGSSVFDPFMDRSFLEFYVCDECLVKKQKFFKNIRKLERRTLYRVTELNLETHDAEDAKDAEEHMDQIKKKGIDALRNDIHPGF